MSGGRCWVQGNDQINSAVDALLEEAVRHLLRHLADLSPMAILAGGSLARGEVSYLARPEGAGRLLSDLDLVVVLADSTEVTAMRGRLQDILHRVNDEPALRAAGVHVDAAPIARSALAAIPATLFWYELAEGTCCLWGDERVVAEIPRRPVAEIDPDEGWILLGNRLLEWLLRRPDRVAGEDLESGYLIARSGADLAKAFLLLQGGYSVSSRERDQRLAELAARVKRGTSIDLSALSADVHRWTEAKLSPTMERLSEPSAGERLGRWLARLWIWAAYHRSGRPSPPEPLTPPRFRRGHWPGRARAWASFLLRANQRDGCPLVGLRTALWWGVQLPPIWVSYLAGVQSAARALMFDGAESWVAPWGYLTQEEQGSRATRLWERLALGGRHEETIRDAAEDRPEIAPPV